MYSYLWDTTLGPRFYDWQLAPSAEEALCECHLHARNLLGHVEYAELLDRLIEDGVAAADQPHEYFYDPARELMYEDSDSPVLAPDEIATGDGSARRVAEPKPRYSTKPSAKRPQKEMFRGPQADLFE